jgi:D-ribose pyranose/furanose isomerase RbsD
MRVCGIEIKSKTAHLVILEGRKQKYELIASTPLKIELTDPSLQESIQSFFDTISVFFRTYNVEKVLIKEGVSKGKFSSGASVFKIETILQMNDREVVMIKPQTLSAFYKKNTLDFDRVNLKKYQHVAFQVAFYALEE